MPRLAGRLPWCLLLLSSVALAQSFRYSQLDIGQGDSAVVIAPSGCAALLDGGPTGTGDTIKAYLRSLGVTQLDLAITSHHHADHIGGIDEVEQGTDSIPIAAVYDRGGSYSSTAFTQYNNQFAGRRFALTRGQVLWLCDEVRFEVVAVNGNGVSTTDENAKSVVVKISYGQFDALVGGDCTDTCEGTYAAQLGELELYKVHHHGSRTSSSDALLDRIAPTNAFISCGWNNTYGHPTPEVISRLQAHGTEIWKTEDPALGRAVGTIELSSGDGNTYTVTQAGTTRGYTSKNLPPSDATPPTAPGALTATASGASQIDLSWTASTDDVGVTGYRISRGTDGVTFTQVGTSSTTGFADLGLTAGTTYHYQVTAVDAAGNVSPPSSVTATIAAPARVILNEVLANEPGSSTAGEFVEVANVGGTGINIGGWTLRVGGSVKHTFAAGTTLGAGQAIVVFGGASGIPPGVSNAVAASSGSLGLVNSGATVSVRSGSGGGSTVDSVSYSSALAGVDAVSANRNPDATAGAGWALHTAISSANSSPGTRADGAPF